MEGQEITGRGIGEMAQFGTTGSIVTNCIIELDEAMVKMLDEVIRESLT